MSETSLQIIVLAAGKGTRMKSAMPKVLHKIAGQSLLGHVLGLAAASGNTKLSVVIGPDQEDVRKEALKLAPGVSVFVQERQKGTADAVLAAREALQSYRGDVLVLYADTPLIEVDTIKKLRALLDAGAGVAVLGFEAADPAGYGRLLTDADGTLAAIREDKDVSPEEREIRLCNSGVMAFRRDDLLSILESIGNTNAKREYYLTDAIEIARSRGARAAVAICPEAEVLGVNARDQLAAAEAIWQARARARVLSDGATLIAPDTVWLSHDTKIGRDVVIEPNVFFGPGCTVEDGAVIKANCHFEGAHIGSGSRIGPFARLRPGAKLERDVHVGNFVEVKNVALGAGAKANHLSYLGDGRVGAGANIGAGTIFCNYDGFLKHKTEIGDGAFVGSNSALVAPVKIGVGAYIGSGSVITKDVSDGSLALERCKQEERPGWAAKFRAMMAKRKARAAGEKT